MRRSIVLSLPLQVGLLGQIYSIQCDLAQIWENAHHTWNNFEIFKSLLNFTLVLIVFSYNHFTVIYQMKFRKDRFSPC